MSRRTPILALLSLTRRVQSTRKRVFRDGTHKHRTSGHRNLETETVQRADSVKIDYKPYSLFDQKSPVHQEADFPRWHTQTDTRLTNIVTKKLNSVKTKGRLVLAYGVR